MPLPNPICATEGFHQYVIVNVTNANGVNVGQRLVCTRCGDIETIV